MSDAEAPGSLVGRLIVVGVAGGIAAYKSALLVRSLLAEGAAVEVVLTRGARAFIGAVTFEGLTGRPVRSEVWEDVADGTHVSLGREADAIVVYPATSHTLARFAAGLADDLLTTTVLAHDGPLVVAPAMHSEMWSHPATRSNVDVLRARGVTVLCPASGALMGGDVGVGRLVEVEQVRAALIELLHPSSPRTTTTPIAPQARSHDGLSLLVTAGGTREAIDPVRFIGNRSSGRMGFAIAEAAAAQGARVVLVAAPSELSTPSGVERVDVVDARAMEAAVIAHEGSMDAIIMAAAVADFRPDETLAEKWRRTDGPPTIRLIANPDILAGVVARRGDARLPVVVGFAAQTGDLEAAAAQKLVDKGVDLLVANDVSLPGIGFEHDENAVLILHRDGRRHEVPRASKRLVAEAVLAALMVHLPTSA